jgi:hypothetical protein
MHLVGDALCDDSRLRRARRARGSVLSMHHAVPAACRGCGSLVRGVRRGFVVFRRRRARSRPAGEYERRAEPGRAAGALLLFVNDDSKRNPQGVNVPVNVSA